MTGGGTTARRETATDLRDLMAALDYGFKDPELLRIALMHPSAVSTGRGKLRKKHERSADNQRLEFLGDRVLGIVIAEMLFRAFPDEDEGALARRLAALVKQDSLDAVAREIALGRYLTISRGEEEGGGRANPAILADACEALIGAIYLDGGLEAARGFVERHWRPKMDAEAKPPQDAKTALQEWAQAAGLALPLYTVVKSEGPPHDPVFEVEVTVAGQEPASARGRSKRAAEQAAAKRLLDRVGA
ncbi:ribonuclease III [Dongia sp. agr-C8]